MNAQIGRCILLLWIFSVSGQPLFSQHSSKNNYTGNWQTPASWSPTWPITQTNITGYNITINGYITVNGSVSFSGSSGDLIVNDTLVIKGDLSLNDKNSLTINDNGILIIWGSLYINKHAKIIANGYLIITGNIIKGGSNGDGSLTSNQNPVKVFVGGTIPNGLTDDNNKFPALNCSSHPTVPYSSSTCSYGNMTDILNDPIYPFFQSTCTTPIPVITASDTLNFCIGDNVTLTSTAGTSYLWSTGATTPNINVNYSGNFTVKVKNASGCESASSSVTKVIVSAIPPKPEITASGALIFCSGDSVRLVSNTNTSYLWSTGATTPNINVSNSGDYFVQVKNASGCESEASAITKVNVSTIPETPAISTSASLIFCSGDSVILASSASISYLWSTGATTSNIKVTNSGNYTVKVKNASGCESAASAVTKVIVNALPSLSITSSSNSMCANDLRTLTGSPAGGSFSIIDGPGIIKGNVLSATKTGNIILEYNYTDICDNKTQQSIIINEKPIAVAGQDQELKFVFETQMQAELSSSETGVWSLISGLAHISNIQSPTTMITELSNGKNIFLWTVRNGNCEATSEVNITVYDIFVPSVITPNGDNKNDYFKITDNIGQIELIIFNKWGNEEYKNGNYLNDWEGRNNKGVKLPNDTYFYILKFDKGKIKKGSVLIKR